MAGVQSEAIRRALVARIPDWYVPWVHLVGPSLVGLPMVACALWLVRAPRAWELATVPVSFVLSNLFEWALHRDILHHRTRLFWFAFDRHTPQHHGAFVAVQLRVGES